MFISESTLQKQCRILSEYGKTHTQKLFLALMANNEGQQASLIVHNTSLHRHCKSLDSKESENSKKFLTFVCTRRYRIAVLCLIQLRQIYLPAKTPAYFEKLLDTHDNYGTIHQLQRAILQTYRSSSFFHVQPCPVTWNIEPIHSYQL